MCYTNLFDKGGKGAKKKALDPCIGQVDCSSQLKQPSEKEEARTQMSHAPVAKKTVVGPPAPPARWRRGTSQIDDIVQWFAARSGAPRVMSSGMVPQPSGPDKLTTTPAKEIGQVTDAGLKCWIDVIHGSYGVIIGVFFTLWAGIVYGPPNALDWRHMPPTDWTLYGAKTTVASLGWFGLPIGLVWGMLARITGQKIEIGFWAPMLFGVVLGFLGLHVALFGVGNDYIGSTDLGTARTLGITLVVGYAIGLIIPDQFEVQTIRRSMPVIETHEEATKIANHLRGTIAYFMWAVIILALGVAYGVWSGVGHTTWPGRVLFPLKQFVLNAGPLAAILGLVVGYLARRINNYGASAILAGFTGIAAHHGLIQLAHEKLYFVDLRGWERFSGALMIGGFLTGLAVCTWLQHRSVQEDAKALAKK